MIMDRIRAVNAAAPFDLLIKDVQTVNVFNDTVSLCDIGIVEEYIVFVGKSENHSAKKIINGNGYFALPGFFDAHMHLESSMLTPRHFAQIALCCGTTSVVADPHEIYNVLGTEGVAALAMETEGTPLHTYIMAPSTVPSLPGFEGSGAIVDARTAGKLLDREDISGLGEVMDFNGVADGEENIVSVVEAAVTRGAIVDGHASLLTGTRLQAFRAAGIDSDHTVNSADKLKEELALGFNVQIQECMLSGEMARAMNEAKVSDRICLVTDDVPITRLMREGHLNHVVTRAIELGLDPMRAIRFSTINPAMRMRRHDVGAIAPGMRADIQLVKDIRAPRAETVLSDGQIVVENGRCLFDADASRLPELLPKSMNISPLSEEDFALDCPQEAGLSAEINVIGQNGVNSRTKRIIKTVPIVCKDGGYSLDTNGLIKMAVFNRYGRRQRGLSLIDGEESFHGAVALSYGHDCHNLAVYGDNDADMRDAANAVISAQGGICLVSGGRQRTLIELPIAGLMSELAPEALLDRFEDFLHQCGECGFVHQNPMSFFTLMPLAVSPEIKCTDKGLLDVGSKRFLPLIERIIKTGE